MKIRVVKTEETNKGKYSLLKVTYRNLETGKVMSTNLPSFKAKEVYDAFKGSAADDCFDVKVEKDGEYFLWAAATPIEDVPAPAEPAAAAPARKGYTSDREWETKAERALRQILIVRQSSATAAAPYSKTLPELLKNAEAIENWVFRKLTTPGTTPDVDVESAMKEIMAMKDDVPA